MNIIRLISFFTIFGLVFFSTTVYSIEDQTDDDAEINDVDDTIIRSDESIATTNDVNEGKDDEDPNRIPSSPQFQTVHIFTQPAKSNELIAGKLTRLLVGTRNTGSNNFIVESIDASFRYPQDFTYYIQNFTTLQADKIVEPGWESTFEYLFMPSEAFNGRPMGLVVLLNYRDNEGKHFQNVVFNQTVNLIDADEGFDGETFFLYLFLGAVLLLLGFLAYQYLLSPRVKRAAGKQSSQSHLTGQQGKSSYDPDWIPKHHLTQNRSPRKSPSQRKSRQNNSDVDGTSGTGAASSENDE